MKFTLTIAILVLAITSYLLPVWAVISFLIYLVKDIPFNWHSVWLSILSIVLYIICGSLFVMIKAKEITEVKRTKLSKFQEKLMQMQKK